MDIQYNQMNAFILNSYKLTYSKVLECEPKISFENYIKSQLHTNVVTSLYNRDIILYFKALKFIEQDEEDYFDAYKEVLKMYYTDIGNSMIKSICYMEHDFGIIERDIPKSEFLDVEEVDIKQVMNDLTEILVNNKMVYNSKIDYLEILKEIPLKDLKDLKPSRLLAESIVYKHYGKQNKAYRLEVK